MLDHDDGAAGRDLPKERDDATDVLMRHAGRRLVEQQELWVESERRRQFERTLAAIGQFGREAIGKRFETDLGEKRLGAGIERAQNMIRAPEGIAVAAKPLQRDAYILACREMWKGRRDLERADNTKGRDIMRLERADIASFVEDTAAGDAQHARQQIEERRLAGAVRTDQRVDAAPLHIE